jgi:hypothetical protein
MVIPLDQEQIDRMKQYRQDLNTTMVTALKSLEAIDAYDGTLIKQNALFQEERNVRKWIESPDKFKES